MKASINILIIDLFIELHLIMIISSFFRIKLRFVTTEKLL